jgi:hypothetical protein
MHIRMMSLVCDLRVSCCPIRRLLFVDRATAMIPGCSFLFVPVSDIEEWLVRTIHKWFIGWNLLFPSQPIH